MKAPVKYIFVLFSIVYLAYLALPTPEFPIPPPDSVQSQEPADTETPLRRAYFTNYSRDEVLQLYQAQLNTLKFCSKPKLRGIGPLDLQTTENNKLHDSLSCKVTIPFLTYRLNYPPEEAYGIIRNQTRSTFLEEIVHPFRESLYINGFEPKVEKDAINIEGKHWRQKITVKWVPSSLITRLSVGILTLVCIYLVYKSIVRIIIYITSLGAQRSNKKMRP